MHVAPCCQLPDATCRGLWAAAGTANQRRRANQHITGRSFAVDARHGGPLAAANLVGTGELYAYALCLVSRLLELKGGLRQLHIDIMCKWRPWSSKVLEQLAGASDSADPVVQQLHQRLMANNEAELQTWRNMRMVNAAAHGSLHGQSCQVIHDSRLAEAWQPRFPTHGRCLCYLNEQCVTLWCPVPLGVLVATVRCRSSISPAGTQVVPRPRVRRLRSSSPICPGWLAGRAT